MIGEFQHNMDQKGRITIPAKFRDELGEKFYVCKGTEKCLFVYSEEKMQQTIERIEALPAAQSNVLRRYFLAGASEADPDKQGRILIPQNLRDHAGLTKECVVIGTGSRAEIWDAAAVLNAAHSAASHSAAAVLRFGMQLSGQHSAQPMSI